jgi:hydroxyisourate hydrolase
MIGISTHVLDTARGMPARGVRVVAERKSVGGVFVPCGEGITDGNGRIAQLLPNGEPLEAGVYRLTYFTDDYFEGQEYLYPEVIVHLLVRDPSTHYHIPLLLSPYGYTTYRGS